MFSLVQSQHNKDRAVVQLGMKEQQKFSHRQN